MFTRDLVGDMTFALACIAMVALVAWRAAPAAHPSAVSSTSVRGFSVGDDAKVLMPASADPAEGALLLIVNSGCSFCTKSMEFYGALRNTAAQCGTPLYFVSREPEDVTRAYLTGHGVGNSAVQAVSLEALRGSSYPTILRVGPGGTVTAKWQGFLSPPRQVEVMSAAGC